MNSNNNKWIDSGGIYYQIPADFRTYSSPGDGIFKIAFSRDKGFGLERVSESFELPKKIYDLGIDDFLRRVEDTWRSKYFTDSHKNLGIVLSGVKGAGKTLSAKVLCNKLKLPVILISDPKEGLVDFIQSIDFECIIFIDEAEKIFNDEESCENSQMLLRMIDGSMNAERKLYVLTTNTLKLNENLIGRPGRIRYIKKFNNITEKAIDEYLNDNLIDKSLTSKVKDLVSILEVSTIDTIRAIVDEANIHKHLDNYEELNLTLKANIFSYIYLDADYVGKGDIESNIKELREFTKKQFTLGKKLMGISLSAWLYSKFDKSLDPDFNESLTGIDSPDVSEYLSRKYNAYSGSVSLKLNKPKVGDRVDGFGTITEIFPDGWTIIVGSSDRYLVYLNKEKGLVL